VAVTTPLVEKGHLERLPEGGDVGWAQVWPLVGERARSTAALEAIERFEVETELFEDTAPELYRRSRVWAVSDEGERYPLSSWAEASSALALGEALAKAGRRPLEVG
jgi:hypothetical protein